MILPFEVQMQVRGQIIVVARFAIREDAVRWANEQRNAGDGVDYVVRETS